MSEARTLAEVIGSHLPKDRYDNAGLELGTVCTCGGWRGDYFADGEAGPFDDHLTAMVLAWVAEVVTGEREAVADLVCGLQYEPLPAADAVLAHLLAAVGGKRAEEGGSGAICGPSGSEVSTSATDYSGIVHSPCGCLRSVSSRGGLRIENRHPCESHRAATTEGHIERGAE